MRAHWLVAKYMSDMRRREAVNVGVILRYGDTLRSRFVGQRPDGTIDGRRVKYIVSVATFRSWVEYWQHAAQRASWDEIISRHGDENYVLEWGGERLVGDRDLDPESFLDYLYGVLVEEAPDREAVSVSHLSETVLHRLQISDKVERRYALEIPFQGGTIDRVEFDYRFDNGFVHLMQRVPLLWEDDRSWNYAHVAAWTFHQAREQSVDGRKTHLIALVKPRSTDRELKRQVGLLEQFAEVVDLADEDTAAARLGESLGLGIQLRA